RGPRRRGSALSRPGRLRRLRGWGPTATTGWTAPIVRAHGSARMAGLPARTIRGTPARRGRPSTPTVYGGEVVFRAGGGGLQTIRSGAAQTAATAPNGQGKGPSVFFNSEDQ